MVILLLKLASVVLLGALAFGVMLPVLVPLGVLSAAVGRSRC